METKKSELLRRIKDLEEKMEEFSENIDLLESELKELEEKEKEVEVSATGVILNSANYEKRLNNSINILLIIAISHSISILCNHNSH